MKKLPAPTAQNINDAHRCARESAENAVEWAIKCGRLLAAKKDELKHGEFTAWVESNCDFSVRSARDYMRAAEQNGSALPFSSLRQLLAPPAGAEPKVPKEKGGQASTDTPKPSPTAESGVHASSAGPRAKPFADDATPGQQKRAETPPVSHHEQGDAPAGDFDFSGYEPEDDEAYKQNIENVMMADDKLAAMREELKQVRRELQAVKASRDHYQSEAGAAARLVKIRDREIEKLRKQLEARAAA
jgi:hypothetical protein